MILSIFVPRSRSDPLPASSCPDNILKRPRVWRLGCRNAEGSLKSDIIASKFSLFQDQVYIQRCLCFLFSMLLRDQYFRILIAILSTPLKDYQITNILFREYTYQRRIPLIGSICCPSFTNLGASLLTHILISVCSSEPSKICESPSCLSLRLE
jgi:hypothetical protein